MKRILFYCLLLTAILPVYAQNLVVNPGAESLPRGTGWTVLSAGALTCSSIPTTNYINWTMQPDGTANYPYDHTTGANGGTVFFSGCSSFLQGPFEARQAIDVSADASSIDGGTQVYVFGGYMQTPVSAQTDQGRFIVDFADANDIVLGVSYLSTWQSFFFGSGSGWTYYTNSRLAPPGTRKIIIRMQTQLFFNQPAINVYFDDLSLTKPVALAVNLLSFTGSSTNGKIALHWQVPVVNDHKEYSVERSADGNTFINIGFMEANKSAYSFTDNNTSFDGRLFYRLRITTNDGKESFSKIIMVNTSSSSVEVAPNPANNAVAIKGLKHPGNISIINCQGVKVMSLQVTGNPLPLDVSGLPAGIYFIQYNYQQNTIIAKLVVRR